MTPRLIRDLLLIASEANRKETEEADQQWIRQQKLLDHLWQQKLDAAAPLDDGYVEIAGFRVPRYRTSCHV